MQIMRKIDLACKQILQEWTHISWLAMLHAAAVLAKLAENALYTICN